jgi:hypothetical protein
MKLLENEMIKLSGSCLAATFLLGCTLAALGQVDAPQTESAPTAVPVVVNTPSPTPVIVVSPPPPKTHLQAMAEQKGVLIVCGYTDVGTVQREDGSFVRITAAEFTNTANSSKEYGLLFFIHQTDAGNVREIRSYLDEDELDPLLTALDAMGKLDKTATPLNDYDAKIRTRGDLEIGNIDDAGVREIAFHGVEIISSSGQEVWAATRFPLARLAEVFQYLNTGKQLIDKAKEGK